MSKVSRMRISESDYNVQGAHGGRLREDAEARELSLSLFFSLSLSIYIDIHTHS